MDLEHFQRLCIQRVKGEKTELECLREMRIALEVEDEDPIDLETKKVLHYFYDRLVDVLEEHCLSERDLLAGQIEGWLIRPTLGVGKPEILVVN